MEHTGPGEATAQRRRKRKQRPQEVSGGSAKRGGAKRRRDRPSAAARGQDANELASLAQLEAENAALLAAAQPHVDALRRKADAAWRRTLRGTGSVPIEQQLREALRSNGAVLEVRPDDPDANQRRSALRKRLRELRERAVPLEQRTNVAGGSSTAAAAEQQQPEVKKLTVEDIRAMAARAKAEMARERSTSDESSSDITNPAPLAVPEAQLSPEQEQAFDAICAGENVFITGPAGTGKSLVLGRAVAALRAAGKQVQVTAPTGVAAELVGGTTIHALCGFGVPKTVADFNKMLFTDTKERLQSCCDVLVIDEVSMLSGELFDRMDELLRRLKQRAGQPSLPFGGIQLVLLGDFHQLSPIVERRDGRQCPHLFLNRVRSYVLLSVCSATHTHTMTTMTRHAMPGPTARMPMPL